MSVREASRMRAFGTWLKSLLMAKSVVMIMGVFLRLIQCSRTERPGTERPSEQDGESQ